MLQSRVLLACLVCILVSRHPGTVGERQTSADPEALDPRLLLQKELVLAAEWGDVAEVEAILAEGADLDGAAAYSSCLTALEAAAYKGREQVVRHLLKAGADTVRNVEALLYALRCGHEEIVGLLLAAGMAVLSSGSAPPALDSAVAKLQAVIEMNAPGAK